MRARRRVRGQVQLRGLSREGALSMHGVVGDEGWANGGYRALRGPGKG